MKAEYLTSNLKDQGWTTAPLTGHLISPDGKETIQFENGMVIYLDKWATHLYHFETWSQFIDWVGDLRRDEFLTP